MPYSEQDKLQNEVEKLIAEVKVLQRPLSQPTSWLAIIGLVISVIINISQNASSDIDRKLTLIGKQQAELDYEKAKIKNDSIQVAVQVLMNNKQALEVAYQVVQKRKDSIDIKVKEIQAYLAQLIATRDSASYKATVVLNEIEGSLKNINAINRNAVPNYFVKGSARNQPLAQQKERAGFQYLLAGNYDASVAAFTASENAFNGYHMVYDLSRLIKKNKILLASQPEKKKEILRLVLRQYTYGAPQDMVEQLKAAIQ